MAAPRTTVPPEVAATYRGMMQECQQLSTKIDEILVDCKEHQLVEETLVPLDPNRRAFRLVGGVLVERTVKEVLPSVQQNLQNLEQVVKSLQERLDGKQKETAEYKAKHNIVTEAQR